MMKEEGRKVVSSLQMGEMLGIKASQVRKDLSYFGEIGKRGVGYHVNRLCAHIENILASPRVWHVALAGVGNLGTALMGHAAFQSYKYGRALAMSIVLFVIVVFTMAIFRLILTPREKE